MSAAAPFPGGPGRGGDGSDGLSADIASKAIPTAPRAILHDSRGDRAETQYLASSGWHEVNGYAWGASILHFRFWLGETGTAIDGRSADTIQYSDGKMEVLRFCEAPSKCAIGEY